MLYRSKYTSFHLRILSQNTETESNQELQIYINFFCFKNVLLRTTILSLNNSF